RSGRGTPRKGKVRWTGPSRTDPAWVAGLTRSWGKTSPPAQLRAGVEQVAARAVVEASGAITLDQVRAVAESGVDVISVGALTHSAPALDLGLDVQVSAAEEGGAGRTPAANHAAISESAVNDATPETMNGADSTGSPAGNSSAGNAADAADAAEVLDRASGVV